MQQAKVAPRERKLCCFGVTDSVMAALCRLVFGSPQGIQEAQAADGRENEGIRRVVNPSLRVSGWIFFWRGEQQADYLDQVGSESGVESER
jgi:hypothetical protein